MWSVELNTTYGPTQSDSLEGNTRPGQRLRCDTMYDAWRRVVTIGFDSVMLIVQEAQLSPRDRAMRRVN